MIVASAKHLVNGQGEAFTQFCLTIFHVIKLCHPTIDATRGTCRHHIVLSGNAEATKAQVHHARKAVAGKDIADVLPLQGRERPTQGKRLTINGMIERKVVRIGVRVEAQGIRLRQKRLVNRRDVQKGAKIGAYKLFNVQHLKKYLSDMQVRLFTQN